MLGHLFKQVMKQDLPLNFPRMVYAEAMERYGSDKPDIRFGLELQDLSEISATCDFQAFKVLGQIEEKTYPDECE